MQSKFDRRIVEAISFLRMITEESTFLYFERMHGLGESCPPPGRYAIREGLTKNKFTALKSSTVWYHYMFALCRRSTTSHLIDLVNDIFAHCRIVRQEMSTAVYPADCVICTAGATRS